MKLNLKRAAGALLSCVMTLSSLTLADVYAASSDFTVAGGWFETAYAEWAPISGATGYNAYYKLSTESTYKKADSELVRGTRVDIPGLKGGLSYDIKVVPVMSGAEDDSKAIVTDDIDVKAFPREGFAFSKGTTTGGYNADGTVPENAQVIYVTNENKDTMVNEVVFDAKKGTKVTCTGISGVLLARQKNGAETTPLIIRIIGVIDAPQVAAYTDGGSNAKSESGIDSAGLLNIKDTQNVTMEGIGYDSGITGFGLNVKACTNVEIRNMRLGEQKDDCVSVQTNNDHIWVHHNNFHIGANGGGDKSKGDGSCDVKANSSYVSVDYNHFFNTGKTSLGGMNSDKVNFFLTYHHNWFDKSGSRHPRARVGSIHVYNNYFDHNYSGGIASADGASVFSEANYFEDTVRPMFMAAQGNDIKSDGSFFSSGECGGVIKDYNNKITTCEEGTVTYVNGELQTVTKACTGCTYWNGSAKTNEAIASRTDLKISSANSGMIPIANYPDAYKADTRDEKVPDTFVIYMREKNGSIKLQDDGTPVESHTYNNFDTDPDVMGDYVANVQSPDEARLTVMADAGCLKADENSVINPDPLAGDVYRDGKITKKDAYYLMKHLMGVDISGIEKIDLTMADADENGEVDMKDVIFILSKDPDGGNGGNGEQGDEPEKGNFVYFTKSGPVVESRFTISGNYTDKGLSDTTYNGCDLSGGALKMEKDTNVSFSGAGTLTILTSIAGKINVDGAEYSSAASNGFNILTLELEDGQHTITKSKSMTVYYISFE